jgi:hypothetical protein
MGISFAENRLIETGLCVCTTRSPSSTVDIGTAVLLYTRQKRVESVYVLCAHLPKLCPVQVTQGGVERIDPLASFLCQADQNHTPIGAVALTSDQSTRFHAAEQPADIRLAGHHLISDDTTGQGAPTMPAENAQSVVLGVAQSEGLDERLDRFPNHLCRPQQVQEEFFFGQFEGMPLPDLRG